MRNARDRETPDDASNLGAKIEKNATDDPIINYATSWRIEMNWLQDEKQEEQKVH